MKDNKLVRGAFEERIKQIPFVVDELRKLKPAFTLEYDEEKGRYKYIFIDTLFKVYEPLIEQITELTAEIIDLKNRNELEVFSHTTSKYDPVEKPEESREIENIAREKSSIRTNVEISSKEVLMYPIQRIHMDRWAKGPELGSVLLFFSSKDALKYIEWYNKTYNTSKSAPDEYTYHEALESTYVPIDCMTLVLEKRVDFLPYCTLKADCVLTFEK